MIIIGIDPGISGGVAILADSLVTVVPFKRISPWSLVNTLNLYYEKTDVFAYIEAVHAMPKQGVSSTFKFGMNYGWWLGFLDSQGIAYIKVYPLKWQTFMQCRTGGNKNVSKARAQELFPKIKITHAIADALLIAEYGRRQRL